MSRPKQFKLGTVDEIKEAAEYLFNGVDSGAIPVDKGQLLRAIVLDRLRNIHQSIEVARLHGRRPRMLADSGIDGDLSARALRSVGRE